LDIKKKRESNKLKGGIGAIASKRSANESDSPLPSLGSSEQCSAPKQYSALRYFNAEVEEFLNKLSQLRIANSPTADSLKQTHQCSTFGRTEEGSAASMMTFAKDDNFRSNVKPIAEVQTSLNFQQ
jgi:hypothetical protein